MCHRTARHFRVGRKNPPLLEEQEQYYSSPSSALPTLGIRLACALPAERRRLAENQKKKSLIQNKGLPRLFRFFLGKAIGRGSCHLFDGSGISSCRHGGQLCPR